jgi:hypothetical protein
MQQAAALIQQITTNKNGFAVDVVWTTADGLTTKTCAAVAIVHGLYIDANGVAVVSDTSRVMVSELALKSASFPTRTTPTPPAVGVLILKDCKVSFIDEVTGLAGTYIIREAIPNKMTGVITCTLGTLKT